MPAAKRARPEAYQSIREKETALLGQLLNRYRAHSQAVHTLSLTQQKERQHAVAYLQDRLYTRSKKNGRIHYQLACILLDDGDLKNAIKHLRCATVYAPHLLPAFVDLADLCFKTRAQPGMALNILQQVLDAEPDHALANKNIGAVYAHLGFYKKALRHTEHAALQTPLDPMIHRNLAKLRYQCGQSVQAIKHNRIALNLEHGEDLSQDAEKYKRLALQLTATGQRESGHAQELMSEYRRLAGKKATLPSSAMTQEILRKTGQKATPG